MATAENSVLSDVAVVITGPSLLETARLNAQIGRAKEAIDAYERLLALWKNPDPSLQSIIDAARNDLARIRREASFRRPS